MIDQTTQEEIQYRFELTEFKVKNPSADEKFYINYRIKVLEKVLVEYYETADFYEGEELDGKEFINGVWTVMKTGTASDYLYFSKELDFFKDKLIELSEIKKEKDLELIIKENPFPDVFRNLVVYDIFIGYTKSLTAKNFLKDYAYLKKRLEAEKLIHKQSDNEFMGFICNELSLITKEQYREYLMAGQLESAERTKGNGRKDKFDNAFKSVCL